MYGDEIDCYLQDTPCFVGTFARDQLPHLQGDRPACIIANTDKQQEQGAHWVALHLRENGTGYYFDSLGLPPLYVEFVDYLNKRCPRGWVYNPCVLQGRISSTCGLYCIHFVLYASERITFDQFTQIFSSDRKLNDKTIAEYYGRPELEYRESLE